MFAEDFGGGFPGWFTLSRRGVCAGCGHERRLLFPAGPDATLCSDSAGLPPLARCRDCGIEDRLYRHHRCAHCALIDRTRRLLTGPDGQIPAPLLPVFDAVVAAPKPFSALGFPL